MLLVLCNCKEKTQAIAIIEKNIEEMPTPEIQVFEIGSIGPAGGTIFFVDETEQYGFKYLELSPVNTEFYAIWSKNENYIPNTYNVIGLGKQNTYIIAEMQRKMGEVNTAAQKCLELNINGYKDWFLPTGAEMELVFENLATTSIEEFASQDNYYATSVNIDAADIFAPRALIFGFTGGWSNYYGMNSENRVRAIRAFNTPNTNHSWDVPDEYIVHQSQFEPIIFFVINGTNNTATSLFYRATGHTDEWSYNILSKNLSAAEGSDPNNYEKAFISIDDEYGDALDLKLQCIDGETFIIHNVILSREEAITITFSREDNE
jgi:hypothetical protein